MSNPQNKSSVSRLKHFLFVAASIAALTTLAWGVRAALRSPMFLVQVVEINLDAGSGSGSSTPLDVQTLTDLAAIPVGMVNLFELNLKEVERRLLSDPWVKEVTIQKRFPQTVSIDVIFRQPKALVQSDTGALSYLDESGFIFGKLSLLVQPDLPVLSGFGHESLSRTQRIQEALAIISQWPSAEAELSALNWDDERGMRAVATYSLGAAGKSAAGGAGSAVATRSTFVDLGHSDNDLTEQFKRLSRVFQYLRQNSIAARQIWADAGKKIVVKTTHGS